MFINTFFSIIAISSGTLEPKSIEKIKNKKSNYNSLAYYFKSQNSS